MKLKLIQFIEEHENWRELLTEKPYCLTIKEDDFYAIFVYSQIDSDMKNPIVQEARGLIIDTESLRVVCHPFHKFFNVQETNAANIDWSTARVQEKLDGSIIKLWYALGGWHLSTNGTIDAKNASLAMPVSVDNYYKRLENYHDLFLYAIMSIDVAEFLSQLDVDCTYMFELVSPFNRVVVPYTETKVYHIGTRNNVTGEELDVNIGVEKPKSYPLGSLEDCLNAVQYFPFSEEGFVVVDAFWNRVKIKSPAYVAAHHLKNNSVITYSRIIDMIRARGDDDFLAMFPEYKESFDLVKSGFIKFILKVQEELKDAPMKTEGRKAFAEWAKQTSCPAFFFLWYDGKATTVREWFWSLSNDRILNLIGL